MNELALLEAASVYIARLAAEGVEVEMFTNFEDVPMAASQVGRDFQQPTFDVSRMDPTEKTAFWAFMRVDGERIGGAAAILQDLGGERFSSFMTRTTRNQYPSDNGGARIEWVAQPLDDKVRGRLCYIGELSVLPRQQGSRDRLSAFMRLIQVIALVKWDVDWVYAFMDKRHVEARKDRIYGFSQILPCPHKWCDPVPPNRYKDEWWVGSPRCELEHMLFSDHQTDRAAEIRGALSALWSLKDGQRKEVISTLLS